MAEIAPERQPIVAAVASLQSGEDPGEALRLLRWVEPAEVLRALRAETDPTEVMNLIAVRCFENSLFDAALSYLEHALSLDNRDTDTQVTSG